MSFGAIAAPEVPPFQLQPLISSVFDIYRPEVHEGDNPISNSESLLGFSFTRSSPAKDRERGKVELVVTCAQALGTELYVGCSDGSLLRFGLQASSESYQLLSSQKLPVSHGSAVGTSRGVDEIVLLPSVSRALILSDHQIHFYMLPALDPVPNQIIRPIRGVLAFAVDEMQSHHGALHSVQGEVEPVEFCVIKRTSIAMYSIKERLILQREMANQGILTARRAGHILLGADHENYNVVDLSAASATPLLPVDQSPGDTGVEGTRRSSRAKPSITAICDNDGVEFLVASATGDGKSAMGIFVNANGDPVRGTLEWPSYPESVCLDFPHILTLMRNRTIEIHNVETQAILQVVSPPSPLSSPSSSSFSPSPSKGTFSSAVRPSSTSPTASPSRSSISRSSHRQRDPVLEPRHMWTSRAGFVVPSLQGTEKMKLVSIPLFSSTVEDGTGDELQTPGGRSERTQFILPPASSLLPAAGPSQTQRQTAKHPRAHTLVISSSIPESGRKAIWSLQALLPATLVSQAEALLPPQAHRIEEAVELAESARRRMLGAANEADLAGEIQYIYQRAGLQRFSETRWDEAGNYLLAGELDPRVLVRYFPDLRGALLDNMPIVDVYLGVATSLPTEGSIEEIVAANLVRNYSPHLRPEGTRDAKPTAELHRVLCAGAKEMLAGYLRKWRTRRLFARGTEAKLHNPFVNSVVDTVLVKLLADDDSSTTELHNLVSETNDIVLSEVEEPLQKNGQYGALCKLSETAGDVHRLLEAWSKIVDGIWTDEDVKDPIKKMLDLLQKSQDRALVQRWALWIIAKDPDVGLKLLISKEPKRSSKAEEIALLEKIREVSGQAGQLYLEYLVLRRRSQERDLHEQLANICVEQLLRAVADEATAKLWKAKASSYASSSPDTTYLSYFASTTPDSPQRQARLKACLFLQGSALYSVPRILSLLQQPTSPARPSPSSSPSPVLSSPPPIRSPHTSPSPSTAKLSSSRRNMEDLFRLEQAILFGKLGRHEDAIASLVRGVGDALSAEAYCTTGGEVVVTPKLALQVGEMTGLREWASLVTGVAPALAAGGTGSGSGGGRTRVSGEGSVMTRQKTVDEETRRELLKVLLRVYMSGGEAMAGRASKLLNSQAINLDVLDVIQLVPANWPLRGMSSFLLRSFRRTQHERHENQLLKAICAGQNSEVVERAYGVLREQGAVVEEAVDDDEDNDNEKGDLSEINGLLGREDGIEGGYRTGAVVIPPASTIMMGVPGSSVGSVAEIRVGSLESSTEDESLR